MRGVATFCVTGSAGHLGEALARTLHEQGHRVVGLDALPSPHTGVVGSITDRVAVRRALDGAEHVLHTATLHKPHVGSHTRQDFVDTNVTGTLTLLEAAARSGARSFVFTSSTSTFGRSLTRPPGQPAVWITEDTPAKVRNVYGATKVAAEDLGELAARDLGLPVVVLRTARFFPEPDDREDVASPSTTPTSRSTSSSTAGSTSPTSSTPTSAPPTAHPNSGSVATSSVQRPRSPPTTSTTSPPTRLP